MLLNDFIVKNENKITMNTLRNSTMGNIEFRYLVELGYTNRLDLIVKKQRVKEKENRSSRLNF